MATLVCHRCGDSFDKPGVSRACRIGVCGSCWPPLPKLKVDAATADEGKPKKNGS